MNAIRQTQALNKRELENAVPPEASWHADYRDTAYIYIGGLPFDLSEGDIITIFSQYGEPVHVDLIRDKETGKSRGFAFLKYEDQRSTDLAVDNLTGATVLGRVLRVDHARYKKRDNEEDEDNVAKLMGETTGRNARDEDTDDEGRRKKRRSSESREDEARSRPLLKEERELQELMMNHDDEDPMKEYLIEEKKEEVARALERLNKEKRHSRRRDSSRERSSRHHRHRHHRHRDEDRSRSRERRHRRDRSLSREERAHRDRSLSRREKSHKERSPVRSRSPVPRRDRERDDRRR
ncbi:RNA binding domain-containing protein [Aspergillus lentulus]|uniref:RNA binding domain-containing protein n=1 Tax=Aspergillus lentulus TaxID=293939 RepID=A0ABQ1AXZ4_ASPLE|nr:RNA binding domain-containing protein [Aspergillus lentulus]GFF50526.1 RNA binding domain-containing protein [Aspergillus lentulus]GFF73847.1 RNA binding domain-containing protein [Aspergillus lentulus]GFF90123.1 RNA binding domain-containing protein [Aspergillus lentulus]GFF94507.1 RNA binding domain-containing protein [Aspergillus lentulus]GFG09163.1 RNA binding domain-containing protein [Aspergillus lentulus]